MQNTVSIVIPNYNGKKLLQKNLPEVINLKNLNKEIVEIIVVDDCSTDDSLSYLKTTYSDKIKTIKKSSNTGFSDSVNIGIKESKGSLVFLLNTDTRPKLNLLPSLLKYFSKPNTFAVGCLDNSLEKGKIVKRGRGIGIFKNGFLTHKRGDLDKNNTLWVSGGSSIYRKSIIVKLGLFDSIFSPFYWEDIDISYRALKSGYDIYFEKTSEVIHEHEEGSITNQYTKDKILEIALTNQILFVWKNISQKEYIINHFTYLIKNIITSVLKGNIIFVKALLVACLKIPPVISHRYNQSKLWVKYDRQILNIFNKEFYENK